MNEIILDLVGKFIVNLGLTDVDKTASHRQKKKLFLAQILKTMYDHFEICLINSFLIVNNINYRALHRYLWHYSLLKYPGEDLRLIIGSRISHPNAEYFGLFIHLKLVLKYSDDRCLVLYLKALANDAGIKGFFISQVWLKPSCFRRWVNGTSIE